MVRRPTLVVPSWHGPAAACNVGSMTAALARGTGRAAYAEVGAFLEAPLDPRSGTFTTRRIAVASVGTVPRITTDPDAPRRLASQVAWWT